MRLPSAASLRLRPLTSPQGRRVARRVGLVLLALLGAFAGAQLAPAAHTDVGPLAVDVHVRPSLHPGPASTCRPWARCVSTPTARPVLVSASIRSVDIDCCPAGDRHAGAARRPHGQRPRQGARPRRPAPWGGHCSSRSPVRCLLTVLATRTRAGLVVGLATVTATTGGARASPPRRRSTAPSSPSRSSPACSAARRTCSAAPRPSRPGWRATAAASPTSCSR